MSEAFHSFLEVTSCSLAYGRYFIFSICGIISNALKYYNVQLIHDFIAIIHLHTMATNLLRLRWGSKVLKGFGDPHCMESAASALSYRRRRSGRWLCWVWHERCTESRASPLGRRMWLWSCELLPASLWELHSKIRDLLEEQSSCHLKLMKFLSYLLSWDNFHVGRFELTVCLTFLAVFSRC